MPGGTPLHVRSCIEWVWQQGWQCHFCIIMRLASSGACCCSAYVCGEKHTSHGGQPSPQHVAVVALELADARDACSAESRRLGRRCHACGAVNMRCHTAGTGTRLDGHVAAAHVGPLVRRLLVGRVPQLAAGPEPQADLDHRGTCTKTGCWNGFLRDLAGHFRALVGLLSCVHVAAQRLSGHATAQGLAHPTACCACMRPGNLPQSPCTPANARGAVISFGSVMWRRQRSDLACSMQLSSA